MAPYPIYLFTFPTQRLLASTFCRFQEHYENPRFRGKAFSWKEFRAWYVAEKGAFTYFEDWDGFNFPIGNVDRVLTKKGFAPLTKKELALLSCLRPLPRPSYVIAAPAGHEDTMNHEIVHGLYHCVPAYRRQVLKVVRAHDLRRVRKLLVTTGCYHPSVHDDEINANALTGWEWLGDARLDGIKPELEKIFVKRFGVRPTDTERLLKMIHVRSFDPSRRLGA